MKDSTEKARRTMLQNNNPDERSALEAQHGQVWDTKELSKDFTVNSFLAPFITVTRKSDGAKGSMQFQPRPRYYFGFQPE